MRQTFSDVVANKIGGKLTDNINASAIKTAEKKLGQAERKAASDLTSSGRAATIRKAQTSLAAVGASKQIAGGFIGNGFQTASNELILTPSSLGANPDIKIKADATVVKLKYNLKL